MLSIEDFFSPSVDEAKTQLNVHLPTVLSEMVTGYLNLPKTPRCNNNQEQAKFLGILQAHNVPLDTDYRSTFDFGSLAKGLPLQSTALIVAVQQNLPAMAKALIDQGADVNQATDLMNNALLTAVTQRNKPITKLLLKHKAEDPQISSEYRRQVERYKFYQTCVTELEFEQKAAESSHPESSGPSL